MKNRSFMTIFNSIGSELISVNLYNIEEKLYVWWDYCDIIHFEFLSHNQTQNEDL